MSELSDLIRCLKEERDKSAYLSEGMQAAMKENRALREGLWECPSCGFGMDRRHFDPELPKPCPACNEAGLLELLHTADIANIEAAGRVKLLREENASLRVALEKIAANEPSPTRIAREALNQIMLKFRKPGINGRAGG